jgi:dCTP diphosphatase
MADETMTMAQLRRLVANFVAEREWQRYHDPKNLSMSIAIETAELMEHFQWVRNEELPDLLHDEQRRARIAEEIADITCFVLALANVLELDLSAAVERKIKANAAKYPVETFRGRYFRPGEQPAG